jgi:hypothetical protein
MRVYCRIMGIQIDQALRAPYNEILTPEAIAKAGI